MVRKTQPSENDYPEFYSQIVGKWAYRDTASGPKKKRHTCSWLVKPRQTQ